MKNNSVLFLLVLLYFSGIGQDRRARGYVLDSQSHASIDSAMVIVYDTSIYTYTDYDGYYSISIPKKRRHLDISHQEYESKRIMLGPGFQHKKINVYLRSNAFLEQEAMMQKLQDSAVLNAKNVLSLSLVEILAVAIGIRYERFVVSNHSLGLHTSWYVSGHNFSFGSEYNLYAYYNGFKAVPFYRFYPIRSAKVGLFLEGKLPFGFFDFSTYEYHYSSNDNQKMDYAYSFWTWGAGLSVGVMVGGSKIQKDFYKRAKPTFNFSLGYQYFPMVKPPKYLYRQINPEFSLKYYTSTGWWDVIGPGAYFEVKITIGGIF